VPVRRELEQWVGADLLQEHVPGDHPALRAEADVASGVSRGVQHSQVDLAGREAHTVRQGFEGKQRVEEPAHRAQRLIDRRAERLRCPVLPEEDQEVIDERSFPCELGCVVRVGVNGRSRLRDQGRRQAEMVRVSVGEDDPPHGVQWHPGRGEPLFQRRPRGGGLRARVHQRYGFLGQEVGVDRADGKRCRDGNRMDGECHDGRMSMPL